MGSYFIVGKPKLNLDRFLTYFQRYLFCRGYVPPDTENEVGRYQPLEGSPHPGSAQERLLPAGSTESCFSQYAALGLNESGGEAL